MADDSVVFVACAPGLEPLLVEELLELGLTIERSTPGGVELVGGPQVLPTVLLGCGLGLRVLVRIGSFVARDFARMERELDRIDWPTWIPPDDRLEVRVSARRSRLYHTTAIAERVERAVRRQCRLADGESVTTLYVRNERDHVEVSIDACGAPLHKRGWRLESGKAPLREDIARALLRLVGFEPGCALIDPVCGSGTLVIEAATIAMGLAPGIGRHFASEGWPDYDGEAAIPQRGPAANPAPMIGRDRNEGAIAIARANAERAGVAGAVHLEVRSVGDRRLPLELAGHSGPVVLVGNLPWGQRVGDLSRLRNLYASFGALARKLAEHFVVRVGLVTPDRMLAGATELGLQARVWTDQGGTRIGLWTDG